MSDDELTAEMIDGPADAIAPTSKNEIDPISIEPTTGWPAPPAPVEVFPPGWDQPPVASVTAPSASGEEGTETDDVPTSWPTDTVDPWPAPPAAVLAAPVPAEPEPESGEVFTSEPADDCDTPAANQAENAEMMARAVRLLDELRDTIAAIGPNTTVDLSGVISDLKVAVMPPGAMAADDVAELREALLAARERPRDVDTIVDLTKRIDAMVALIFAYDRTIAAIERSLEALRGWDGGDGVMG